MAETFEALYTKKYSSMVNLELQVKQATLLDKVTSVPVSERLVQLEDVIQPKQAERNRDWKSDTPISDASYTQRWLQVADWLIPADLLADEELVRAKADPTSAIVQSQVAAYNRAIDQSILRAMFDVAKTGVDGGTNTSFDSNQEIGINVGGTNSGLNLPKLKAVRALFDENYLGDEPIFVGVTPKTFNQLLSDTQLTSSDFMPGQAIATGVIPSILGSVYFVKTLLGDYKMYPELSAFYGTADSRNLPVWTKGGIQFGTWKPAQTNVSIRPDKKNAWQIFTKGSFNATRVDEKMVARIVVKENA